VTLISIALSLAKVLVISKGLAYLQYSNETHKPDLSTRSLHFREHNGIFLEKESEKSPGINHQLYQSEHDE
jgi:hypothetical protein